MKSIIKLSGLQFLFLLIIAGNVVAQLSHNTPESQGVSSAAITRFIEAANKSKNEFHSFMLIKNGNVIAETWWNPYASDLKHTMYSVSKSFTSTAVGFAVGEGKLSVSDKVVSFFPAETPDTASTLLRNMTIKDLITMSAGQSPDPTFGMIQQKEWIMYFLNLPIVDIPGSRFLYNSAATFMLSAIVQKVTGEKIIDYLKPRLFDPLEISDIDWELNPEGINAGGWGLRLKTSDMAKFGQLYLQKGRWNGQQIIPEAWVEEATSFKIKNSADTAVYTKATSEWAQGYCYQFWRCRNNAYRADGAFGQYIIVMPDQEAVIAITSETGNMQDIMNLIWEHLFPSLKEPEASVDKKAQQRLKKLLKKQTIPVSASTDQTLASTVSGKTYMLESNEKGLKNIHFQFEKKKVEIGIGSGDTEDKMHLKEGKWVYGTTYIPGPSLTGTKPPSTGVALFKTAATYHWKDASTLLVTIRYIESPHTETLVCNFKGNNLELRVDNSIKAMSDANEKNKIIRGSTK